MRQKTRTVISLFEFFINLEYQKTIDPFQDRRQTSSLQQEELV